MTTAQDRLNSILPSWYELLTQWSLDGSLVAAATEALVLDGSNAKPDAKGQLQSLTSQWSAGNFKNLPQIVLLSNEDISGAQGAYAASTGTIYLNQEWLLTASDEEIQQVLTEELGHYLDDQLNEGDTKGDEGEFFARTLIDKTDFTYYEQQIVIRQEDSGIVTIADSEVSVENASFPLYVAYNSPSSLIQPSSSATLWENAIGTQWSSTIVGSAGDDIYRATNYATGAIHAATNGLQITDLSGNSFVSASSYNWGFGPNGAILNSKFNFGDGYVSIITTGNSGNYVNGLVGSEISMGAGDSDINITIDGSAYYSCSGFSGKIDAGEGSDVLNVYLGYIGDANTAIGSATIDMGDGNDVVSSYTYAYSYNSTWVSRALANSNILMGSGDDTVDLYCTFFYAISDSTIDMGTGNDRVILSGIASNASIGFGDGADELIIRDTSYDYTIAKQGNDSWKITKTSDLQFSLVVTGLEEIKFDDRTRALSTSFFTTPSYLNGNSLYKVTQGLNWLETQAYSRTFGGDLVTINSSIENDWLSSNLPLGYSVNIGMSRSYYPTGGPYETYNFDWSWSDGTPVDYTNWNRQTTYPFSSEATNLSGPTELYGLLQFPGAPNPSTWYSAGGSYTQSITEYSLNLSIDSTGAREGGSGFSTILNLSAGSQSRKDIVDGARVYWAITGIDASDLSSGQLNGEGIIVNGQLVLNHSLKADGITEGDSFNVSVYSDSQRQIQIGSASSFEIVDAANGIRDKFLSLNAATLDYVSSDGLYIPQSGDFTVSVWARATSLIPGQNIQILSQGTSGDNGFYIGYNPNGFIRVGDSWGGWSANGIGVPFPTDGRWHCYQVVKKGSIGYLYIDGVRVGTTETYDNPRGVVGFQNPIGGDALLIGKQFTGFGEYWDGGIDDVTIFSESLSEAELSAVRNSYTIASIPAFRSDFNSSLTFTGSGTTSLLTPSGSPELLPLTDAGEKLISVSTGNDSGLSVALQADGKFVIGGLGNNNTSIAAVRLLSAAAEDVQFGNGGASVLSLSGSSTSSTSFSSDCIAIQSDGKILLGTSANYDFRIYRINADGSQDLAFGNTGTVNLDFLGGNDTLSDIISLPNGKILLVGFTGNSNGVIRIVKLNQDGSIDTSYGTNGIVSSDGNRYASSAALQADGKLLVAGNDDGHTFFSRFNTDGSLDTTLNASSASPGSVFTSRGYISLFGDVTVQSDGKIVAAGYYAPNETLGQPISGRNYQLMVVRTNPDGSYDSSFGISGVASIPVSLYNDRARSVVLQADGKILISGSSDTNGTDSLNVFTIVRLNTDGSLDTSFASNGILKVDVDEGSDSVGDMYVDESGRITVVGTSYSSMLQKNVISVIRVDQYGNLDKSFPSSISGDSSGADFSLANSLIISGSGTGTLDGVPFSDVFAFNLGGLDDIITINESAGTSIQMTVEGGDGNDTLNGNALKNKLVLTGINQGTLDGIQFSGIENINLGSGNDEVYIMSGGMLTGLLNGGSGGTVTVVPPGGDIGDYDGGGGGGDGYVDSGGNPVTTDPGPTTPDPIEFKPVPPGFGFNGGLNSIFMNDDVNIASINGPGYGVVDGTDFLNFYALDLKGNDDIATINPLGYLFGKLSGGDGSDTLNLSANSNVLSIDQGLVGDVDRTDFESFEIINLLAGDDSVSVNINALPPGYSDPRKSLTLNGGDDTDQLTLKITREEVRYLELQGTFDDLQAYLANPTGTTITIALSSIDLTLTGFEKTGFFNSSPNQIAITSTQFDENLAVGSVVASLSAVDPDQADGLTYRFVGGNGLTTLQSGIFTLDGDKVKISSVPDYETSSSYEVTVRVSDDYGAYFDEKFTFTVNDVFEPTSIVGIANASVTSTPIIVSGTSTLPVVETFTITKSGKGRTATSVYNWSPLNIDTATRPLDALVVNGGDANNTITGAGFKDDPATTAIETRAAYSGLVVIDGKSGVDTITGGTGTNWLIGGGVSTSGTVDSLTGTSLAKDIFDLRREITAGSFQDAYFLGHVVVSNFGAEDFIVMSGQFGDYVFNPKTTNILNKRGKVVGQSTSLEILNKSNNDLIATVAGSGFTSSTDLSSYVIFGQTSQDPFEVVLPGTGGGTII